MKSYAGVFPMADGTALSEFMLFQHGALENVSIGNSFPAKTFLLHLY